MPAGRPTSYTPEILAKARGYLATKKPPVYDEVSKTWDVDLPSIADLAGELGVIRETVHEWVKDPEKAEFSVIIKDILREQEKVLKRYGLGGQFNPTISKLILGKHGYHDKVDSDMTNKGEKFESEIGMTPAMLAAAKAYEEAMKKALTE